MKTVSAKLLRRLYAEYVRDGNYSDVAARHGIYKKRLGELFRAAGLEIRNDKSKLRVPQPKAAQVRAWHREYMSGVRLKVLAEKYHHTSGFFAPLFRAHGLRVHPPGYNGFDWPRKTEAEITALIERAATTPRGKWQSPIHVPKELKQEWRDWPLARRADFITRLRAALQLPDEMPTTPHSANVEPFDYGSEHAWRIANAANAGLPSRDWKVRIFPSAQGMIFREQLWFWVSNYPESAGGIYVRGSHGPYQPGSRLLLHQFIWSEVNGPVPSAHVIRFTDGNMNNLDPSNLYLQSRADEASENRLAVRLRTGREQTALLLQRPENKEHEDHSNYDLVQSVGSRRAARGRAAAGV